MKVCSPWLKMFLRIMIFCNEIWKYPVYTQKINTCPSHITVHMSESEWKYKLLKSINTLYINTLSRKYYIHRVIFFLFVCLLHSIFYFHELLKTSLYLSGGRGRSLHNYHRNSWEVQLWFLCPCRYISFLLMEACS